MLSFPITTLIIWVVEIMPLRWCPYNRDKVTLNVLFSIPVYCNQSDQINDWNRVASKTSLS